MQLQHPPHKGDHALGNLDAPLVIVHYGDFECPFSGAAHTLLQELKAQRGDRMCVVFRHFPLGDIHPHAEAASHAAEAASRQGAFWPMHDLLFEHQQRLMQNQLLSYAEQLGLDVETFEADMKSDEVASAVRASIAGGQASGAHGTPTFWINGVFHDNRAGLWEPGIMAEAIEAAMR